MRIRHKPYAGPELAAWSRSADDPAALRGNWKSFFAFPDSPFRVELGCGKGGFLAQAGLRDADCNHLGIDLKNEMLVVAKRTIEKAYGAAGRAPENVAITSRNIEAITGILAPEDRVQRLYINFCNPWHKSGHAKHRLTHPRQLVQYRDFLLPQAQIWFKTDDDELFNASLRYFKLCAFEVEWMSRDLHREEPAWNLRTEHEGMFTARGIPIKAAIARMLPAELDKAEISTMKNI